MTRRIAIPSARRCATVATIFALTTGCTAPWTHEQKSDFERKGQAVRDILSSEDHPRIVHEVAGEVGLVVRRFESFGMVARLAGTGGKCNPSPQTDLLLAEMRANDVPDPIGFMDSPETAMVKILTEAPPGARKHQMVDALVKISRECDAKSLRNGYLLDARLQEIRTLGNSTRKGAEKARVEGPVLHMPIGFTGKPEVDYTTGVILGGAKLLDARMMGIRIRESVSHVMTATAISKAINERFYFSDGTKRGVAIPKDDGFVSIDLPPNYHWDPQHFIQAVLHVGFLEKSAERAARLEQLRLLIAEPTTARAAALQLEAIGKEGTPILREALTNRSDEVRFYSAYSLAYLDDPACIPVLAELAHRYPEFRYLSLVGLAVVNSFEAREALEALLQDPEPEVRYGAMDALFRKRNDHSDLISMTGLATVSIMEVPSEIPLVAISLQERPEITIFGYNPPIFLPSYVEIHNRLLLRRDDQGNIRIVRFQTNDVDQAQTVQPNLRSVLEGLDAVGATYNDMVQFIDDSVRSGILATPVAFNPKPQAGRVHRRDGNNANENSIDISEGIDMEPIEVRQSTSSSDSAPAWWDVRRIWTKKSG